MHNISDNMLVDVAADTAVLNGATQNAAWFDMKEFDRATFVVRLGSKVATPDVDIEMLAAEDDIGTNDETLKTAVLGDPDAGIYAFEFKAEDLPEGKPYVSISVIEKSIPNGDSITSTVIAALHGAHHKFENKLGAVAVYKTWE